jgi:hypothetical protein
LTASFGRGDLTQKEYDEATKENAKSSANLGKVLGQIEAALDRQARAAQKAADAKIKAFDKAIAGLQREQAQEDKATAAAEARATKAAAIAAKQAKAAEVQATFAGKYRQNLIALGYSFNDFFGVTGSISQRLNAIANNLPGVLAGFGGLGLALSGIVPIIAMVVQNWDNLKKAFGGTVDEGVTQLDRLEKRVKELSKEHVELVVDRRELERSEEQLERLKKALNDFRALQQKQTSAEHEAGRGVEQALGEAGAPQITEALRQKFIKEQTAQSQKAGPLAEAQKAQADAEKRLAEWSKPLNRPLERGEATARVQEQERARRDIATAQEQARKARLAIEEQARKHVGEMTTTAVSGHGAEQTAQREQLAKELEAIGQQDLARQIRDSSAAAVRWWQEAEATGKIVEEFMEEAARDEKAALDERKRIQQETLDELIRSKELDAANDAAAKAVNAKGLGALESFQALKDEIQQDILASLRKQKVDLTNAEAITARAAGQEAEQAFTRVGRAGQKAATVQAKADTKAAMQALDDELNALVTEAKEERRRREAEAKRIQASVGAKEAAGQFSADVGHQAAATGGDPEAIAARVAARLAATFARSQRAGGLGATPLGAQIAAQQIAARAGFRVTLPQIQEQQPPQPQPAPRRPAQRPRQAPAPAKKPAAAAPKPGGFHTPTEQEVNARRDRERRARQNGQPAFRSVAPTAALAPVIERTQDGVLATQTAVANLTNALNARCARIERGVAILAGAARGNRRLTDQMVTRLSPDRPGNLPPGLS